ncbi:DUF2970 domain-containing protein [Alteromonas aestuariivivens]|uniref:DUF2970 domain-containing protein n=1 Tax=Alteromonas aestuariivivens TaxID=1938339 RepID=A0A3D8M9K9_9ALTE|nr:DUF2970 domain-containing protein [Alteromonas aestuariivivens]RDV26707.1 DUF2970 domain-containing protein [Alteromonas aestuariivivens]
MPDEQKPSVKSVLLSVLASLFGVQSQRNYKRDFTQGALWIYIAVGILMVGVFILSLLGLVWLILP